MAYTPTWRPAALVARRVPSVIVRRIQPKIAPGLSTRADLRSVPSPPSSLLLSLMSMERGMRVLEGNIKYRRQGKRMIVVKITGMITLAV
jgi:hypothetical protein